MKIERTEQTEKTDRGDADVIVLGAGVSGLVAAGRLLAAGRRVIVVEARARPGGRIDTRHQAGWPVPIEAGAEFVHGQPPLLTRALRAARAQVIPFPAGHWVARAGALGAGGRLWQTTQRLLDRLTAEAHAADTDLAFEPAFRRPAFRRGVAPDALAMLASFVEGFNAADPARVSLRSLAQQTRASQQEHGERLGRVRDGYDRLIDHLARPLRRVPGALRLSTIVRELRWDARGVEIRAHGALGVPLPALRAAVALVTLPLGVLQQRPPTPGAVRFVPALPAAKRAAIQRLAMGPVLKVIVRFRGPFWRGGGGGGDGDGDAWQRPPDAPRLPGLSFLHTPRALLPTWWVVPRSLPTPMLVGWIAGPAAQRLVAAYPARPDRQPDGQPDALARAAVRSLSVALGMHARDLDAAVEDVLVVDWAHDPFARGAYSWIPAGALDQPATLAAPIGGRLFFAGEATDTAGDTGTVHGAMASGERAAREIIAAVAAGASSR